MAEEIGEDKSECSRMIKEADKDEDGGLNYEEFIRVIKKTSYEWYNYYEQNNNQVSKYFWITNLEFFTSNSFGADSMYNWNLFRGI